MPPEVTPNVTPTIPTPEPTPVNPEPAVPAAGGQPAATPPSDLTAAQQAAFTKHLGAERAKIEREVRAQTERDLRAQIEAEFLARIQPQTQPDPDDIARQNEEWLARFYDNPREALSELVTGIVEPKLQSVKDFEEMRQWESQAEALVDAKPDFDEMIPVMEQVITEKPYLATLPNALEVVYDVAKARQATIDPLSDPAFRQKILSDETIRNEIIKSHLEGIQKGAPPIVIGGGGSPPATPPNAPKTLREATRMFLSSGG